MELKSIDTLRTPSAKANPTGSGRRDVSLAGPGSRSDSFVAMKDDRLRDRLRREILATVALSAILAFAAFAVTSAYAQVVLQAHSAGEVDYVTGGVGKEEADVLKQASADYALTVELASSGPLPTGDGVKDYYISGATVDIRDSAGRSVLSTTTDGPLLLARLPDGLYTIESTWNGIQKHATVEVSGGKRSHVVFDYARGSE
jgi:hypothetical protein